MVKGVYFFIPMISILIYFQNVVDEEAMKTSKIIHYLKTLGCNEENKGTQHVKVSLTLSLQLTDLSKF